MNRLEVKRWYRELGTYGNCDVVSPAGLSLFSCKTLELPWRDNRQGISCIKEGVYTVIKEGPTKLRPYVYFRVLNVPGRKGILWHPGNYTSSIRGCTLPGEYFMHMNNDTILDIANTGSTLRKLVSYMDDRFTLIITNGEKK